MKNITSYFIIIIIIIFLQGIINITKLKAELPKFIDENTQEDPGKVFVVKATDLRPKIEYSADTLRNPFEQPLVLTEPEEDLSSKDKDIDIEKSVPNLVVQGLIWGSSLPQAIVNNKVVKVGDVIEGADIIDINKEGVIVLFAGTEYKLSTTPARGRQDRERNE
ncbi:MAG: hypothetical protein WAQ07_02330 [Candidatus Omnitrophota bacterium]